MYQWIYLICRLLHRSSVLWHRRSDTLIHTHNYLQAKQHKHLDIYIYNIHTEPGFQIIRKVDQINLICIIIKFKMGKDLSH